MIPVKLQPEPDSFDEDVRKKGHAWLRKNSIALNAEPPRASELPPYWSKSNEKLWEAYSGVCAYLAIYFEWPTGAASTDHFVAKSRHAGDAYEWSNYRLSCLGANRNKSRFNDVLDPIGLSPRHTFFINFGSGKVSPNPNLPQAQKSAATRTISRLKLNSVKNNEMRSRHYYDYASDNCSLEYLSSHSPFVHQEVLRQDLD